LRIRPILLALAAFVVMSPRIPSFAAGGSDTALVEVVDGPQRAAGNKARDAWRHPIESLSFWGLKPGMTVVEIAPGGGYWSEILAPYAKLTHGRYIVAVGQPADRLPSRFGDTKIFGNFTYSVFNASSGPLAPPGTADFVLTARNIHDWMWTPGLAEKAMSDFYKVLKPGGILAVEEHRADPRPMIKDARDGYVATSYIIGLARKSGFTLEAQSQINANPKDTKDYPFGVWTLPPTRQSPKTTDPGFDRAKYDAIGESDRMTLRFRKL
jgi:predicted methyltransferase